MKNPDVIVVGGGASGLAVGALLANEGKKVLVLEKEKVIGGRASADTYKGRIVENGPHSHIRSGDWEEVLTRLGKPLPKPEYILAETVHYKDGKWLNPADVLDRKIMRKLITEISSYSYEELEQFDGIGLKDWVSARTDHQGTHDLFWALSLGASGGGRYETWSAGESLFAIKRFIDYNGNLQHMFHHSEGAWGAISGPLVEVIEANGGEVRTGCTVSEILIENGRAYGVEVEAREQIVPGLIGDTEVIKAPMVVCTLPLWDLFKVLNSDNFPRWYVDWVEGIKNRVAMVGCITVGLDKPLKDISVGQTSFVKSEDTESGLVLMYTYVAKCLGNPGESVLTGYWMGTYEDFPYNPLDLSTAKTRRQVRNLLDSFDRDFRRHYPDLEEHLQWEDRFLCPFSLALSPGTVGKARPSMIPPGVKDLYIVSDTVEEGRGAPSQCCARAALVFMEKLTGKPWMTPKE